MRFEKIKLNLIIQIFFICKISSLNPSPILFPEGNKSISEVFNCSKKDNSKFTMEISYFENPNNFPESIFNDFAKDQAFSRYSQLKCLKKIQFSKEQKQELMKSYMFFRQREIEALEIYSNFFYSFENKNLYAPGELQRLREYLKTKDELYRILDTKTRDFLFNNEVISEEIFISIYQSLLRLQYDILANLSPKLRNEVLKKINNL